MENSKFKPDYFKVAYGIRTPSYYRPKDNELGFQSEAESMAFFADCERVFRIGGWKIEHGYAVNGKSSLHLHPQQFLGTIHEELLRMRCRNSLLKQRYFNFSRMANGLLRKSMTSQRSSSGSTLQQSVRKLKRNFSTYSGLHSGSCIMIRAVCCGGISSCRLDGNTDFRQLTSRSTIRPVTMFPKCSPL